MLLLIGDLKKVLLLDFHMADCPSRYVVLNMEDIVGNDDENDPQPGHRRPWIDVLLKARE